MSERRAPEELFESLLDYEHDDPDARPMAELTTAERDAELSRLGVDPDAVRARGADHAAEILARLAGPAVPPTAEAHDAPVPVDPSPALLRGPWPWVLGAIIVAAILARLLFGGSDVVPPPMLADAGAVPTRADATIDRAAPLIASAREACARHAWTECLRALDDAHALRPAADQGQEARALRAAATEGLSEAKRDAGPEKGR